MSLYLSEWMEGYDDFIMVAEHCYKPTVVCSDNPEKPGNVRSIVYFIDIYQLDSVLRGVLPSNTFSDFVHRFNASCTAVLTRLGVSGFLERNLGNTIRYHELDLEKASDALSLKFEMFILDFEFLNHCNVVTMLANLIFYGTWEYPNPYFFVLPPMSEWENNCDGDPSYD